jgi:hypothetical protein
LIGWRDQLAHSYLHERLRREGDDLVFAEGTAAELRRLHDEYEGACLFLEEQLETISADLTDDLASIGTEDAAALEALARKMFQRTPRN